MLKSIPMYLPEPLLDKAGEYAARHHTTLTALVIEHLESIAGLKSDEPVIMYSRGLLTKEQAIKGSGLDGYGELLASLDLLKLPIPAADEAEIEEMASSCSALER